MQVSSTLVAPHVRSGEHDAMAERALPTPVLLLFLGGALFGMLTSNPLLTMAAILALPIFIALLRRPGEPPVLLFAVAFQWLQVTSKVFHANVLGIRVTELSHSPSVEVAIWLGLGGLIVLAAGMWAAMYRLDRTASGRAALESLKISVEKAFLLYLLLTFAASFLRGAAWGTGGFAQVLISLAAIRWVGFFILGYAVLKQKRGYLYLFAAIAIEFIGGLGFFSGFKTVIFYGLILVGTVYSRLNVRMVTYATGAIVALLIFGSAWTVIKPEFRAFLNEGSRTQSVRVSPDEQMAKLVSLVTELTWQDIGEGMEPLFRRVAYVDYFAHTIDYVPEVQPHERGEVWKSAIQHALMPRFIFPDKPRLPSDSEHTMMYTGLRLATGGQGTSISIGYMGDAYIDFGVPGMFGVVFLLGILWGLLYTYFIKKAKVTLLGFAMACSVLLPAYQFEMVSIKLLGGILMSFLVFAALLRFVERPVWAWLRKSQASMPIEVSDGQLVTQ
jgi:hypothetical protein